MKTKQGITWGVFHRIIITVVMLLPLSEVIAMTQAKTDSLSVTVNYTSGSSDISRIAGNIHSLEHFILQMDSVCHSPYVTPFSFHVISSTSPEGSILTNQTLSRKRNESVINYLNQHSETFRNISPSLECKFQERNNNHLFGNTAQSSYPSMRYSKMTLFYRTEDIDTLITAKPHTEDKTDRESEKTAKTVPTAERQDAKGRETTCCPLFFVKTNLLYDLATFVNASVEVPITKDITAEATLVYPWWRNTSRHKTIQMRYVSVTPRYYFGKSDIPYTSFFAGVTVGTGKYDLQWTRRGVQGTLWNVSPTFGYSHHIAKRWKMEYSASIGFVRTKYTKYTQTSDTPYGDIKVKDYPWVSKVLNTVLPTSLNVSLVYTFTKSKKTTGHHER